VFSDFLITHNLPQEVVRGATMYLPKIPNLICIHLKSLGWRMVLSFPNMTAIRGVWKLTFCIWTPTANIIFLKIPPMQFHICTGLHKLLKFKLLELFLRKSPFCSFQANLNGPNCLLRIFIFTRHQPTMDRLLNMNMNMNKTCPAVQAQGLLHIYRDHSKNHFPVFGCAQNL
jgi:hypothetical protein